MVKAFTLIELAIVIIIIGLIVGGVLGANSLIKSATLNQQISQLTEFDQGANSFLLEYDALPGDILRAEAASYGIGTSVYVNEYVQNNNGIINTTSYHGPVGAPYGNGVSVMYSVLGEPAMFFIHMANTNLINYSLSEPGSGYEADINIPGVKFSSNRILTLSTDKSGGLNYLLGLPNDINSYNNASHFQGIKPELANKFDKKIDDGVPNRGFVRAVTFSSGVITDTSTDCVQNSGANYNLSDTDLECALYVKAKIAKQ